MTEELLMQQMREMRYTREVDVVDAVMAQVSSRGRVRPLRSSRWRAAIVSAAACALLAVGVNTVLQQTHQYDTRTIGGCLSEVYDYHADYGHTADVGYYIGVEELF